MQNCEDLQRSEQKWGPKLWRPEEHTTLTHVPTLILIYHDEYGTHHEVCKKTIPTFKNQTLGTCDDSIYRYIVFDINILYRIVSSKKY